MKTLSLFLGNCRLFALMPVLAVVLLSSSGCTKTPEARTVDVAVKRYNRVKVGMSKQEIVDRLGEPSSKQELRYRWETVAGSEFNALLEVRFDGADKVVSITRSRSSHD